jgi:hypothetical protein
VTHSPDTVLDDIRDMPLMEFPCVVIMSVVQYSHSNLLSGVNRGNLDTHRELLGSLAVLVETELTHNLRYKGLIDSDNC